MFGLRRGYFLTCWDAINRVRTPLRSNEEPLNSIISPPAGGAFEDGKCGSR